MSGNQVLIVDDICVRHSAADAFQRGYNVEIPSDCAEAFEDNEAGIKYLEKMYNAKITTSSDLIKQWS